MASTRLSDTMGTPTLGTKFTYSCWVKRSALGSAQTIASMWSDSSTHIVLRFDLQDNLSFYATQSSTYPLELETNAVFRDTSAWYHIVAKVDTTQATSSDRCKLYVNGSEQTSLSASTYPSQDATFTANASGTTHYVGGRGDGSYWDGLITHAHFTDGYAYDASDFGQTDSTSGIWKPKTSPSVTYGTNGFFLKMENSSDMGEDSSGNNNDFTTSGTITQTEDTPSNNFSVINFNFNPDPTNGALGANANGGLSFTTNFTSQSIMGVSTLGVNSGKWYAEFKLTGESGSGEALCGIGYDIYDNATSSMGSEESFFWSVCSNGDTKFGGSAKGANAWSTTYTTNDIISVAMDLDNNRVYFAKNGQYANGSGSWNQAFTASPAYLSITADKTYFFMAGDKSTSQNASWTCNFGNGYFATTAVASSNSDSAGLGLFEFSVPANYYSLCTNNIKNYG